VFNIADFHVGERTLVIKRWSGRPPRARHTTPMISLDRLACRAYGAQALKETFGEDSPLATRMPATPATEVQHKDHRNTLDGKALQKTSVLAMAQAQTCHTSRTCTKVASEPVFVLTGVPIGRA